MKDRRRAYKHGSTPALAVPRRERPHTCGLLALVLAAGSRRQEYLDQRRRRSLKVAQRMRVDGDKAAGVDSARPPQALGLHLGGARAPTMRGCRVGPRLNDRSRALPILGAASVARVARVAARLQGSSPRVR